MKFIKPYLVILFFSLYHSTIAQVDIKGKVQNAQKEPLIASIRIVGSTQGTQTDTEGDFQFKNLSEGIYLLKIQAIGYKSQQIEISLSLQKNTSEIMIITLQEDIFKLEDLVVTGTRTPRKRTETAVMVDLLDTKTFENTNATNLAQGLNFQAGLRVETDCQTCNYTQLRMNGLGGSYSQILINSRPIFSAMSGLYGLEQIPSNMVERIEVVRGGGSALFGANAIAGTVNIITKEPQKNSYQLNFNQFAIRGQAFENQWNNNFSFVKPKQKAGISFFHTYRTRQAFDANADGFTEMPRIKNHSFGLSGFYQINPKTKLKAELFKLYEYRRGGNLLDLPAQLTDQAEERTHHTLGGGITLEHQINDNMQWISYASGQKLTRKHYTGIQGADGWGDTQGNTTIVGTQLNYTAKKWLKTIANTFTVGTEWQQDHVIDEVKGYNWYLNQQVQQLAVFGQSDWQITQKIALIAGLRADNHSLLNQKIVLNPRLNALYQINNHTQLRASWATGFRAPQALDADLHMAFANGGIAFIRLNPMLKQEKSQSYTLSLNYDKPTQHYIWGYTLSSFYTKLYNAFALVEVEQDQEGNTIIQRQNTGNATVRGITAELRANFNQKIQIETGFTLQQSFYDSIINWSKEAEGTNQFLRTPQSYGFYTLQILPQKPFNIILSGVFTGSMLVPHFGGAEGVEGDRLVSSPNFWDNNLKISYTLNNRHKYLPKIQLWAGIQNIFDAYQQDFDRGVNRDSSFIYGPMRPRTFAWGIKLQGL